MTTSKLKLYNNVQVMKDWLDDHMEELTVKQVEQLLMNQAWWWSLAERRSAKKGRKASYESK